MKTRFTFDPGAALLLGLLLFLLDLRELGALLCAVTIHELGHLIAILCCGIRVTEIAFTISGPVLKCDAPKNPFHAFLTAVSGPAAGVVLWIVCIRVWPLCASISLLLSCVNLLPVLPLDGGRALGAILPDRMQILLKVSGVILSVSLMICGLFLIHAGYGPALAAFGGWLLILTCQGTEIDVK